MLATTKVKSKWTVPLVKYVRKMSTQWPIMIFVSAIDRPIVLPDVDDEPRGRS
jgi:hypothetical protein